MFGSQLPWAHIACWRQLVKGDDGKVSVVGRRHKSCANSPIGEKDNFFVFPFGGKQKDCHGVVLLINLMSSAEAGRNAILE